MGTETPSDTGEVEVEGLNGETNVSEAMVPTSADLRLVIEKLRSIIDAPPPVVQLVPLTSVKELQFIVRGGISEKNRQRIVGDKAASRIGWEIRLLFEPYLVANDAEFPRQAVHIDPAITPTDGGEGGYAVDILFRLRLELDTVMRRVLDDMPNLRRHEVNNEQEVWLASYYEFRERITH